jgi:adenylate kinase family enzyme
VSAAAASVAPLELAPPGLSFEELDHLRSYLDRTLSSAPASLRYYYNPGSGGFLHKVEAGEEPEKDHYSKASTATCLHFLAATGLLDPGPDTTAGLSAEERAETFPWASKLRDLRRTIVFEKKWDSAGLGEDNPFTVSFLLEAIHDLSGDLESLDDDERAIVESKLQVLVNEVLSDADARGGVSIPGYPSTAFLTQAAVRVLKKWGRLNDEIRDAVDSWAWGDLHSESVFVASRSPDADVFELVYSVLTASAVRDFDEMTPQQRGVLQYALDQFFERQNPETGTWPRSRPLFLYPTIGYAYCFDYELLVQLLGDRQLFPTVYGKLKQLALTAYQLDHQKYPLGEGGVGWSSRHHGQRTFAESWSTASVFHFCFALQRNVVAEAIRRAVFEYAGGVYSMPTQTAPENQARLPASFLDSRVKPGTKSLKRTIETRFLQPLLDSRVLVEQGQALPATTPVSAILFGPPGTSKSELARRIAQALGWPFLALDPSHVTRNGLDQVHAESHRLFDMLEACDEMVVLLDEFDELVRERESEGTLQSRFLTTAMLPKLAALSARRRIVYIIATNHLERFDVAIRRRGRFDMILPVMPPTSQAKLKKWPNLKEQLDAVEATDKTHWEELRKLIADLTYSECEALVRRLENVDDTAEFTKIVTEEGEKATLSQRVQPGTGADEPDETWRDRLADELDRVRIPEPNRAAK